MNRKIIAGAAIAVAAGIAAFLYNKRRNRLSYEAESAYDDAYDFAEDTLDSVNKETENLFA